MAVRLRRVQQRDAGSYYREMKQSGKSGNATFAVVLNYIERTRTRKTRARANM